MLNLKANKQRKDLFGEISNILNQWPELHRGIFIRIHYHGQSPAAISGALKLEVAEVNKILEYCDRQLHTALRGFRPGRRGKNAAISTGTAA